MAVDPAGVRALAAGGVEGLLASLRPMMSWSGGELRIPTHVVVYPVAKQADVLVPGATPRSPARSPRPRSG